MGKALARLGVPFPRVQAVPEEACMRGTLARLGMAFPRVRVVSEAFTEAVRLEAPSLLPSLASVGLSPVPPG
jgi:hypothetical protein